LRVVENVERLGTKLHVHLLGRLEYLVQRHIKLRAVSDVEAVPPGVPESQALLCMSSSPSRPPASPLVITTAPPPLFS
jgi:hypothetical protein